MLATFNDNPCTSIIFCYSPTNASDKTHITTFYNDIYSLVWYIPKHNVLIIGGNMNVQIGKDGNDNTIHQTEMEDIKLHFVGRTGLHV